MIREFQNFQIDQLSNSDNPFLFFQDFLTDKKLTKIENDFFHVPDESDDLIIHNLKNTNRKADYIEYLDPVSMKNEVVYFEDALYKSIEEEFNQSKRLISSNFIKLLSEQKSLRGYFLGLKTCLNQLQNEIENSSTRKSLKEKIVNQLFLILESTYNSFNQGEQNVVENHLSPRQRIDYTKSYFGIKGFVKNSTLRRLYDRIIESDLEIFDDLEVNEEHFIDVFANTNPKAISKIRFNVNNQKASLFLNALKDTWFDNLGSTRIESSNLFLSKTGTPLKANTIDAAYSKANKNINLSGFNKTITDFLNSKTP